MSKHTPSPWVVINKFGTAVGIEAGETRKYINGDAKDQIVMMIPCAEYNGGNEATLANARLIAAAPELLQALSNLMNACYKADLHEELSEIVDGRLLDAAETAIFKAVGDEL